MENKIIDEFKLELLQDNKFIWENNKKYGFVLEEFRKQIEYNLRNGRGVRIDNYLVEPVQYINTVEDVIDIFYKNSESTPLLTVYLLGMLLDASNYENCDEVGIAGKAYKYNVTNLANEGGLEVTKEQKETIDKIMKYLEDK